MRATTVLYSPEVSETVSESRPTPVSSDPNREIDSRVRPYLATAVAALAYSFLALRRVWELKANAFDAAFIDNVLYKVSTGLGDVSGLGGVSHFADHASALLLAAIPLYWVDADVAYQVLLVLQGTSVAMVGLAAWLVADTLGLSRRRKDAVLLFVLASPMAYWAIITELHMTGLSMGLVAMTIAGAYRRWRLSVFWILPFLASLARIEIAAAVVVAGLLILRVSRIHGKVTIAIGASVAALMGLWMIFGPSEVATTSLYFDYLGVASISEVPLAMLRQPRAVLTEVLDPVLLGSAALWLVSVGIVLTARAARWYLVGVPMFLIALFSSPLVADLWYQHYWNLLLVGAAVAVAGSLAVWKFSDSIAIALVVATLAVAWILAGPINGPSTFKVFYPNASGSEQHAAEIASSAPGALSAMSTLVLPGAHRDWLYEFPNPFACRERQFAGFVLAGPPPDVVITRVGWERFVRAEDIADLRRTLATDYTVTETTGLHTVRMLIPGATPALVDECAVVAE